MSEAAALTAAHFAASVCVCGGVGGARWVVLHDEGYHGDRAPKVRICTSVAHVLGVWPRCTDAISYTIYARQHGPRLIAYNAAAQRAASMHKMFQGPARHTSCIRAIRSQAHQKRCNLDRYNAHPMEVSLKCEPRIGGACPVSEHKNQHILSVVLKVRARAPNLGNISCCPAAHNRPHPCAEAMHAHMPGGLTCPAVEAGVTRRYRGLSVPVARAAPPAMYRPRVTMSVLLLRVSSVMVACLVSSERRWCGASLITTSLEMSAVLGGPLLAGAPGGRAAAGPGPVCCWTSC